MESLDEYDAVVQDIAEALESEGIVEPGSIEIGERGAQFEDDRCRVFAKDAEAVTVYTQPEADQVRAVVAPVLEGSGFASLENTDVEGGYITLSASDEQGALLELTWKSSEIDVGVSGVADLEEALCTDETVR